MKVVLLLADSALDQLLPQILSLRRTLLVLRSQMALMPNLGQARNAALSRASLETSPVLIPPIVLIMFVLLRPELSMPTARLEMLDHPRLVLQETTAKLMEMTLSAPHSSNLELSAILPRELTNVDSEPFVFKLETLRTLLAMLTDLSRPDKSLRTGLSELHLTKLLFANLSMSMSPKELKPLTLLPGGA